MAWLESHTVLIRHRKTRELAIYLKLKPVYVVGHLHALWHTAIEQQEDGDLSKWSDALIAEAACYEGDPKIFVESLKNLNWIEKNGLIHDWLDYAGRYLTGKYRTANPRRLKEIYKIHKSDFSLSKDTKKTDNLPYLPNLTIPYLPNQQKENAARPKDFQEVKTFFNDDLEAEKFWNHFESNGWKVGGRAPMKNWKAAAKNWLHRNGVTPGAPKSELDQYMKKPVDENPGKWRKR